MITAQLVEKRPQGSEYYSTNPTRRVPDLSSDDEAQIVLQNLKTSLPLHLADVVGLAIACLVAFLFSNLLGISLDASPLRFMFAAWVALTIAYALSDLYPGVGLTPAVEFRKTAVASTVVSVGLLAASMMSSNTSQATSVIVFWIVVLVAIPNLRSYARSTFAKCDWWSQPVLIVGCPASNRDVLDSLRREPQGGLRAVGIVHDVADPRATSPESSVDFAALKRELRAHRAIVTGDSPSLPRLSAPGVGLPHIHIVSNLQDGSTLWARAGERAGCAEVQLKDRLLLPVYRPLKRSLDLAVILAATPLWMPIFAVIAVLIKLTSRGPLFYCQKRVGLGGRHFFCWKFRTMVVNADEVLERYLQENPTLKEEWERDHKLKRDPRVMRVGKLLRKTSLDELPQLWNVIVGDMSLVGPRPIVDAEIPKYGDVFRLYRQVPPGISGLWQISGRNNTTYEQRLQLDRFYIRNWSPWLDAYILLRTVKTVVFREGAY